MTAKPPNERQAKCLFAARVALEAAHEAQKALDECEDAIDKFNAAAKAAAATITGLRKARVNLLESQRFLYAVAGAWLERVG